MSRKLIGSIPGLDDLEDHEILKGSQNEPIPKKEDAIVKLVDSRTPTKPIAKPESTADRKVNDHESRTSDEPKPGKKSKTDLDSQGELRAAGGVIWRDQSLAGWNPAHPRIFVGDLSKDVDDKALLEAFSKYSSANKARVVRDKHTGRSKGYGFVAFESETEFREALKEMQGKYIGDRPVKLKKSNWADRTVEGDDQVRQLKKLGYKIRK